MTDEMRIDTAQRLMVSADFEHTVTYDDGRREVIPVMQLRIPPGVGVSGNIRQFLDDAYAALR